MVLYVLCLLNHLLIVKMKLTWLFSIGINLINVHLKWLKWFLVPCSRGMPNCYSNRLHSLAIPRCYKIQPVLESCDQTGHTHFWPYPPKKNFYQLLIYVNLYQQAKNQAVLSIFLWLIKKCCNLIDTNIFDMLVQIQES